jgi:hypothetical protein
MLGQFKWVYAFFSPIGGYVADRFSRRAPGKAAPFRSGSCDNEHPAADGGNFSLSLPPGETSYPPLIAFGRSGRCRDRHCSLSGETYP